MNRIIAIFLAVAALEAGAVSSWSARLGALGRNDTVVTNVAEALPLSGGTMEGPLDMGFHTLTFNAAPGVSGWALWDLLRVWPADAEAPVSFPYVVTNLVKEAVATGIYERIDEGISNSVMRSIRDWADVALALDKGNLQVDDVWCQDDTATRVDYSWNDSYEGPFFYETVLFGHPYVTNAAGNYVELTVFRPSAWRILPGRNENVPTAGTWYETETEDPDSYDEETGEYTATVGVGVSMSCTYSVVPADGNPFVTRDMLEAHVGGVDADAVRDIVTNEVESGYSEWTCTPSEFDGEPIRIVFTPGEDVGNWTPMAGDAVIGRDNGAVDATEIVWPYIDSWGSGSATQDLVAVRHPLRRNSLGLARLQDLGGLPYVQSENGTASVLTVHALTSGSRAAGAVGRDSAVIGASGVASAHHAVAMGRWAVASNNYSYVFNGAQPGKYGSHGIGTYNVNPMNGVYGFYVGGRTLVEALADAMAQATPTNLPCYGEDGTCIGTNAVGPCSISRIVANIATQTLYTVESATRDVWTCAELEGDPLTVYTLAWTNGMWYANLYMDEPFYFGDVYPVAPVAGSADATSVTMSDPVGDLHFTKVGPVTEEVAVWDFTARLYDSRGGQYVGETFDVETNGWRVFTSSQTLDIYGVEHNVYCLMDVSCPTNLKQLATERRWPVNGGPPVLTNWVTWAVDDYYVITQAEVVATMRDRNALGLARFADLDRYAVPRQRVTDEVRRAVNLANNYIFDGDVCWRRQIVDGGYLEYVAVTNIDLTLPENWLALEMIENQYRRTRP